MCKIWTKVVFLGFWSVTPWLCDNQSKSQSWSTNLHTKHTNILTKKNFAKISQFLRKTYIVCKFGTKMVLLGFWNLTPGYVTIEISLLFHRSVYTPNTTIWPFCLKNCTKTWHKNGFVGLLKSYLLATWQSKFQSCSVRLKLVLMGLIFLPMYRIF